MHLSAMPRVTLTCKALDLDYAVAMVGFEVRGGMSVPCFDGVVACEEHAEAIKEAYYAAERYDTLLFLPHLIVNSWESKSMQRPSRRPGVLLRGMTPSSSFVILL